MTLNDVQNSSREEQHKPIHRRGKRLILRSTSMLPALLTIGNGICGFTSIHFATKYAESNAWLGNVAVAAWLLFAAMVFDMLDGRVARMTRKASDFGAQLDSLCDTISFGVAPAMLMLRVVVRALRGEAQAIAGLPSNIFLERLIWCVAGIYVACTVLRLARFNVETEADESAHMVFKGLPSPAAAAAVGSLVLLFVHLSEPGGSWLTSGWAQGLLSPEWLMTITGIVLPVLTLAISLLMVSNFSYPHVINQWIRGKKPFSYIVKAAIVLIAAVLEFHLTLALVTSGFAVSGMLGAGLRKLDDYRKNRG